MSNNQNTTSQPATDDSVARGMAALETLASVWSAKIDLQNQAWTLAEKAGLPSVLATLNFASVIREFAKSAYMEGAYQHLIDSRDEIACIKADRDRIRMEIVGALTDAGICMLAGDSDPTAHGEIESAIKRLTVAPALVSGYSIRHVDGRWRTLDSIGMLDWTDKQQDALCFSLRAHAERYAEDDPEDVRIVAAASRAEPAFDLIVHLERQAKFSLATFGPGPRVKMVLDHIRKELIEIEAKPTDLYEWIDLALLALDGAWRAGFAPNDIAGALGEKLARNEARTWPDWRDQDSDKAIEHTPDNYDTRVAEPLTYPEEMTAAIRTVLGRPNFTCIRIAHLLRRSGVEIAHKAEDEQASVIHFLLKFALRHGEMWADVADEELMALRHAALKATGDTA